MLCKKLYLYSNAGADVNVDSNADAKMPMPRFPNGQFTRLKIYLKYTTTDFSRFSVYLKKDTTTDVYILKPKANAFLSPTPVF